MGVCRRREQDLYIWEFVGEGEQDLCIWEFVGEGNRT